MKENTHTLAAVRAALLKDRRLDEALRQTNTFLAHHAFAIDNSQIEAIQADYDLMIDFMLRGYNDPQRSRLYEQLVRRLYRATFDIDRAVAVRLDAAYTEAAAQKLTLQPDDIKHRLESFVAETALLAARSQHPETAGKTTELHKSHQQYLHALFSAILVSPVWSEGLAEAFQSMLLAPTIDQNDQCLIVSALTLAAMNFQDINKLKVLIDVSHKATDESLRQRAFVGWALAMTGYEPAMYPELKDTPCSDNDNSLADLQIQLIHCLNADADHQTIQRDIMPDLLKNSHLRVTRMGIEEVEDPTEDILHPEAADEAVERVEQGMRRMFDMQRQGSDIYFGGFSQMKRFPFFTRLSNWFMPFYLEHPQLPAERPMPFMMIVLRKGLFCDSDKYSLALSMNQIAHHMPPQMKEMTADSVFDSEAGLISDDDPAHADPTQVRRLYLQDLYRFFRLHPQRASFVNPFEEDGRKPSTCHPLIAHLPERLMPADDVLRVARFLNKQRRHADTVMVLSHYAHTFDNSPEETQLNRSLLMANALMHNRQTAAARDIFNTIRQDNPSNEQALRGWAQTSFIEGDYSAAADAYGLLSQLRPDNHALALNHCVAAIENGQAAEVMNELFRLNYEQPDDKATCRAIAWACLKQAMPEKALPYCQRTLDDQATDDDLLNAAYSHWALRHIDTTLGLLRQFLRLHTTDDDPRETLYNRLTADRDVLETLSITSTDINIMVDSV